MAKKRKKEESAKQKSSKNDDSKLFAFLAVFLSIVGFIIALIAKKDDKYVMYYAKQSLVLFIAMVIARIISLILSFIPIIGQIVSWTLWLLLVVLWVISFVNALSGEEKETPLIGKYARELKI